MSSTTKAALRAAQQIEDHIVASGHSPVKAYMAEIIDRETGASEMLEALEQGKRALFSEYMSEKSEGREGVASQAWLAIDAAIQKAKGGQ